MWLCHRTPREPATRTLAVEQFHVVLALLPRGRRPLDDGLHLARVDQHSHATCPRTQRSCLANSYLELLANSWLRRKTSSTSASSSRCCSSVGEWTELSSISTNTHLSRPRGLDTPCMLPPTVLAQSDRQLLAHASDAHQKQRLPPRHEGLELHHVTAPRSTQNWPMRPKTRLSPVGGPYQQLVITAGKIELGEENDPRVPSSSASMCGRGSTAGRLMALRRRPSR